VSKRLSKQKARKIIGKSADCGQQQKMIRKDSTRFGLPKNDRSGMSAA